MVIGLEVETAALLCHAKTLVGWHVNHQFCSRCGAKTAMREGGLKRVCVAEETHSHFPRTDPVVISLVTNQAGDKCLVGRYDRSTTRLRAVTPVARRDRQAVWPKGRFSCLAGFVDTSETIEQAVRREVYEESGVQVGQVRYFTSQVRRVEFFNVYSFN